LLVDDELNTVIEKEVKEKGKIENLRIKYKTKKGSERYGLVYSETIETGGKKYILNIMVDVTEERKATLALEYKSKFQEILMDIASEFINSPVEKALNFIDKSLEKIGKFVKADRVYIFDYDFRNRTISNTYEWCDKNIEPQIGYLQEVPMDSVISWVKEHKKGNTIIIPEVESYTGDDQVRKILEDQDVKSLITVPMMEEGKCIGFVGFDSVLDYKKYKDEEIQLLKLFAQTILDIRKREKKEEELLNSLEEKSILMKEIHHRVKNNLQLVSSLIFLQSFYIEDIKVKKALKDTENRIKSMAMLHEKIYRAEEINKINFKDYIESIIEELQKHNSFSKKIKFYADIQDIDINIDESINCGLIINELITNSIQHGFTNKDKGEIGLKIFEENKEVSIVIYDNGGGFKKRYEEVKEESLGLIIVESLTKQLGGSIQKENYNGTKFIIKFKKK